MPLLALLFAACTDPATSPDPRPSDPDEPADPGQEPGDGTFFDRTHIGTIDLQLTDAASATLASDEGSTTWVESRVELSLGGEPRVLDRVGLQVKGSSTFVAWPGKASLKMKLDEFVPGQDVDGVDRVALHNLVKDPSYLREAMAWWAFRELGSPGARATHVAVLDRGTTDWEPNNLYVVVEAINGDFLESWFEDPSGPMWESAGGGLDNSGGLYCDRGDCTDTSRLDALGDAIVNAPDDRFVEEVSAYLDWEAYLRFWAIEAMVQQNDGFSCTGGNFRVYWEPTRERFFLIPWSLDQTFGWEKGLAITEMNTLVSRCLAIGACRDDFHDELLAVADEWEAADAVGEIDRMQALLVANGFTDDVAAAEYQLVRAIVLDRPTTARAYVDQP